MTPFSFGPMGMTAKGTTSASLSGARAVSSEDMPGIGRRCSMRERQMCDEDQDGNMWLAEEDDM